MKYKTTSNTGCKYRKWAWHDGGPDYRCIFNKRKNTSCIDSWSAYYFEGRHCKIKTKGMIVNE